MRLAQKNVVVVGVGPGLGSAVAYMALREGASVYAYARRPEALAGLQWLAQHGKVSARDFAKLEQALAAAEEVRRVFPQVHGLVVAAGGYAS